jgi:hypothetical protein
MEMYVSQPKVQKSRLPSFFNWIKVICPVLLLVSLMLVGGGWGRVYASQGGAGATLPLADQGTKGVKGYVVGSGPVAAYACPDTNTAKCPIRLTLAPGTQVLIVDNVVGGFVPALNDNAWRKILVQGQLVFVPMHYISVTPVSSNPSDNVQDISFTLTGEDDSISAPGFSTAPVSKAQAAVGVPGNFLCFGSNTVLIGSMCCPPGTSLNGSDCVPSINTSYVATDGRMMGGAGDRIAVYCRRTGRIDVWSINDSQGHFLVSFNHVAVDSAGKAGLRASVGTQGVVTINGDGRGAYLAAIQGGPFKATGQGDFAKSFQCYASS